MPPPGSRYQWLFISFSILIASSILIYSYSNIFHSENPNTFAPTSLMQSFEISTNDAMIRPKTIDVLIVFSKITDQNPAAIDRFRRTVSSLLKFSTVFVNFHIVADNSSKLIAERIFDKIPRASNGEKFRTFFYDMNYLAKEIDRRLSPELMKYFRHSPQAYYGDPLFFLSIVASDLFPHLNQTIKLDFDLWFRADIAELWTSFERFTSSQLFGFAREQEPVYRHVFNIYRSQNHGTRIGDPPPIGITGFNSGVILLDLEKIRRSSFRTLIDLENVKRLAEKYQFQGHLGDQDLYTLLSTEHAEIFYELPCRWNRQLNHWWRENGYAEVFDLYHKCDGKVRLYHGNGQTAFPKE